MARRLMGFACALAFVFVTTASFGEEGGKADSSKAGEAKSAAQVNTYKCDKTGKTWTQCPTEKKACPSCGAANPDCGTQVKSDAAAKTVWTCRMHKFVAEDKAGRCKTCNLKLVEVPASSVPKKQVRKNAKGELVDVSKEAEECEKNDANE